MAGRKWLNDHDSDCASSSMPGKKSTASSVATHLSGARAVWKGEQQLTLAKVWPGSAWQTLVCSYALPLYKDWSFLWHIQFMACCFRLWPVVSDYGLSKCLNNYNESRMLRRRAGLSIKGGAANCLMIQTTGLQGYSCVLSGVWSWHASAFHNHNVSCAVCYAETRQSQWSQLNMLSTEMYTACHWRISCFDNYTWHPTWNHWHGYVGWYQSMPPALGNCIWSTATICICYKDR